MRVALFNVRELSLVKLEPSGADSLESVRQVEAAAEILRRVRPDVLVLNEIDHVVDGELPLDWAATLFRDRWLDPDGSLGLTHGFAAPNNTGRASGMDLDRDGTVAAADDIGTRAYGNDAFGYGEYPGQYSMALLSRFPIRRESVRTFQEFLWADLPGHHLPVDYYGSEIAERLRLSSKSHQDVPIDVGGRTLHLLLSHPTPPVFDGEEDRNGRRNFDEIRFWALYLDGRSELVDDVGVAGGLDPSAPFVIAGDLNAQPVTDQAVYDGQPAIRQLLTHPRVQDSSPWLISEGARALAPASDQDGAAGATADFGGGSRVDYLLPSRGIEIVGGGVFWPSEAEDPEGHGLALAASDHRLLWLDLVVPES